MLCVRSASRCGCYRSSHQAWEAVADKGPRTLFDVDNFHNALSTSILDHGVVALLVNNDDESLARARQRDQQQSSQEGAGEMTRRTLAHFRLLLC
jgi:hypothetical protein